MRDVRSNKKINIHKNNPALIGRFKQRSNATLILDLYDEFSNYVDLSNQEISIRVERPDGVTFEQVDNIAKNSNILTIELKNEILEVEGECRVELNLKDSEGQMNTADFFFEVGESVLNDHIVFSSDSYESLEKALVVFRTESNALMKKLDDNERIRISNENTRKSQETERVNAENSRISKENERVSQENTRKSQEETRKSNENTRQNQERMRQESENTRKSQETNRVNKENERKNNEDTRKTNESDRQTRFTKLESDGRKLIAEMNAAIDGTITREVTEARGTKAKLGLRLNDLEQQSVENTNRIEQLEDLTPVWQEHEGTGSITVNDSFDGATKDLVIRGRTLKNLVSKSNFELGILSWSTGQVAANNSFKRSSDFIAIDGEKVISNIPIHIFEYDNDKIFINSNPNSKKTELALNSNTRFIKICLDIASGDLSTLDLMLIVDNDLPSTYFDSITSCGELEDNKIKIKSFGKNLFDPNYFNENAEAGNITRKLKYKLKPNTQYTCSSNIPKADGKPATVYFNGGSSDTNGVFLNTPKTFTSNSLGEIDLFIRVNGESGFTIQDFINGDMWIQLEENSIATNYEQYREKLIEIPLPFAKGLKSTLDGTIYDEINGNTGEIIQRVSDEYTALAKPVIHKINDIQLNTFDERTHITQENNILSDISFQAKVSLSSQAKRLSEENKVLKEENVSLKESSIKTSEEQEVQDQKITTTMLANTELFEMMLNFMPKQLDDKQFRGGEKNMVEVYVTLIIQGDKTLEQVPAIIRPQVEAKLRLLGIIA